MSQNSSGFIARQWKEYPLRTILILAFAIRLLAAIFSQGYGMHDDHFLVIEAPWSWSEGADYNNWLPWNQGEDPKPTGHNLFYPGFNYLQFAVMKFLGIDNPKVKMFFIRLILGLFSLLTVLFGYKMTQKISGERDAKMVGLLLGLFWFMPFLSIRNLVESVAIPVLFAGIWLLYKTSADGGSKKYNFNVFLAGLITATAIAIRYQAGLFLIGIGLVLLFQKKFRELIWFTLGATASFILIHGIMDSLIWGKPFTELGEYIRYNLEHKGNYGNANNPTMYFQVILGMLIPPLSVFLFFGFFKVWKKLAIIFIPNFLFLAFHTYFPNKQERFILTIIPFVIMLGVIGWNEFMAQSKFWQKRQGLYKGSMVFFWIINTILLIPLSLASTKMSRVNAMAYFYGKEDLKTILVDDTGRKKDIMLPVFYTGRTTDVITLIEDNPNDATSYDNINTYLLRANSMKIFEADNGIAQPQYILFVEDIDLEARIEHMKSYFPNLEYEADIEPSIIDKIMKKLNPVNKNEELFVYKTGL